ncbi:MAG: hydrogenase expression/formation protein HypE [Deltaproteobacteria bacterium]|nr:hydrogenase expression/formation protein HypE [Deltaproteobacteria bacterium]
MDDERIQLGHGGGGRLSRELVDREILPRFGDGPLRGLPDAARLPTLTGPIVFTTDSFVVQPLRFPGGNIGHLAVHGTVNDLAVSGARPRWLSLALILEEGLPRAVFREVLDAVRDAAAACDVQVVTGDTKVVPRGQCDGMYVNTAGIGEALPGLELDPAGLRPGDELLVSGPLGDHGMAVMAAREGIAIAGGPVSDTAPVHRLVEALGDLSPAVRFMRDPTRGGAAAVLNELVGGRPVGIQLEEAALPFSPSARAVAEALGLDLLHVASEGRVLLVCAPDAAAGILERWRARPEGRAATRLGRVTPEAGRVVLRTAVGGRRLVDVPQGELLPRIC